MIGWIGATFPQLVQSGFTPVSNPDGSYNCIAFAAGIDDEWWEDTIGYKWPGPRSRFIDSLVAVFEGLEFVTCDNGLLEPGYDKIALYALGSIWTHAARQRSDGKWISKLGPDEDIEHNTAEGLQGARYGFVYCFMRRHHGEG